uniref:MLX interacting protein n=1 Tax=Nothobranchius furzeri TaxID=105023 RepID=A0A8C6Q2S9_NOTFU
MYQRQADLRPAVNVKQEQDDDSDTEESQLLGLRRADGLESQIIHSGHFMVSSPHCEHPPKKGYDFDTVNKQTCQTYHFGKASMSHLSIDASLTKLFECMTLAYSGKLVSPKWKNFKGLKLLWRDKIRLNNAIWRAWYMQYVEKRENPVCHFVTPLDGNMDSDVNRPAEVVATDGKCWKRRIEIVIREYHKWRTYFKKRLQKHKDDDLSSLLKGPEEQLSLFGEVSPDMVRASFYQDEELAVRRASRKHNEMPAPMEMDPLFDMDVLMSEFSDTLFSTLASHQPIAWPNPREIAHAGNADMIQPGLIPLQPNLDFMDSFDPLQDLFHSLRQPVFPSVPPTASSVTPQPSSSSQTQTPLMSSLQLSGSQITPTSPLPPRSPMDSQASQTDAGGKSAYVPNYMPLFGGQVTSSDPPVASSVSRPLSQDPPAQCLPSQTLTPAGPMVPSPLSVLDETIPTSVVTHTSPSTVTPSVKTTTFSNISASSSKVKPRAQLPATHVQQPKVFAMPRSFQGNSSKVRPVQRIAPALSSHLLFPGFGMISFYFESHYKVKPTDNLIYYYCFFFIQASGFQMLSPTPKSPQSIATSEKSFSTCQNNQKETAVHSNPGSSQGSPHGLDQVPSPQSIISSCSVLIKNEYKQVCSSVTDPKTIKHQHRLQDTLHFGSHSQITNAVTLQKTVEHIGKLQQERQQMQEEVRRLREEIEELSASINLCQEQLPATGVHMRRSRLDYMQEKFDEYVKTRTLQNWKFWIFSIIIKPLFESFNGMVSTMSRTELHQTTLQWLDNHCSLPVLRPMVLSTLRQLSTTTSILTDPSLLPKEAIEAVAPTDR